MKWPKRLTLIRHGESEYNALKILKNQDPTYLEFRHAYENKSEDFERARLLAEAIYKNGQLILQKSDQETPLTKAGSEQALATGKKLSRTIEVPNIIFVSPYLRTYQTLHFLTKGWPELSRAKVVEEERIREQEHGLLLLFNDWRLFEIFYPEQEQLREQQGSYWYRYPQGENVPDVRERLRSWLSALTRDFKEKEILVITHHLSILALRANLERMNAKNFTQLDEEEKPINCGVTCYLGKENLETDGRLLLESYNQRLY